MRSCFAALLLFVMPAFAAITKVQQSLLVNVSSSSTCMPNLSSGTATGDLLVVWATWTPGNTISVTSVGDSQPLNSFPSAVGPTLQASASPQISAQIFYAKNIHSNSGSDNITVQFSGTATSASCVAVEYSGVDQNYPLDSVSAGYGYSTGTLLDSGTAAPANANLLVFGGGTTDAPNLGNVSAGSGFTSIVANFSSITEQYITTSPNNTLQRASALSSASGNWVMQMAIFRDASWTVSGGWSPVRPYQVRDATQFPGTDACAQTQTALEIPISGNNSPVVDSRGFTSTTIPCAAAPFGSSDTGVLYLPNGTIQQNAGWTLGSGLELIGGGRGTAGEQTFIQAQNNVSGTATAQPMLTLGTSTSGPIFGTELREFSLDGHNKTGSIGIQDDYCQEQCEIDHLKITGTQVAGADFGNGNGGNFIQHGINFHNFELNTGGGGDTTSCGPYPSSAPTVVSPVTAIDVSNKYALHTSFRPLVAPGLAQSLRLNSPYMRHHESGCPARRGVRRVGTAERPLAVQWSQTTLDTVC